MARQKRDQELMHELVDALERTGVVSRAADLVGIRRRTAYRWLRASLDRPDDPEYTLHDPLGLEEPEPLHVAWRRALDIAMDEVEHSLRLMATGIPEPVIYEGQQQYEVDPLGKPVVEEWVEDDPIKGPQVKFRVRPCYRIDPKTGLAIPLNVIKRYERSAEILLKAHRPEKFRERYDVKLGGAVQVAPLLAPARAVSEEEFERTFGGKQG